MKQDAEPITIGRENPTAPDLALLMERHTADMHADTPPESIYMMDAAALDRPDIAFYVMRAAGQPVGMAAIKPINDRHAEIKSMHVLAELRGKGLSRRMLTHLLAEAATAGFGRLSLETGVQAMFQPARMLYANAGFAECPAFEGYAPDPNSVYMTRALA